MLIPVSADRSLSPFNRNHRSGRVVGSEDHSFRCLESKSAPNVVSRAALIGDLQLRALNGAEEGTRTPTPLRVHGPEPCASANSATSARHCSPLGRVGRRATTHHFR